MPATKFEKLIKVRFFRPYLRDSVHRNVSKGQRVMVQGRIMYGSVEDKAGVVR